MGVLLLPILLAFVGMAVDLGMVAAKRRDAQNAVDSAALAGAGVLIKGGTVAAAKTEALSYATKNGYAAGVTVNIPPASGPHLGDLNYVEVLATRSQPTFFIRAVGISSVSAGARGVGGFTVTPKNYALAVLNKTMCSAYNQGSNSTVNIIGGGAIVNSSCNPSASQSGGSFAGATYLDYYSSGGWQLSNNATTSVPPSPVSAQVPDPLASLARPVPCSATGTPAGCVAASPDSGGTAAKPNIANPNAPKNVTLDLHPGTYYGGLKITGNGTVNFLPGLYVFASGGFDYGSTTTVTGSGVTFFNTGDPYATDNKGKPAPQPCAQMSIVGSGTLTLSAPASGTYKNILFWQDDSCTVAFKYAGTSHTITGVIYLPTAQLNVSGGGSLGAIQVIVDSFDYSGSNSITITFSNYVPITPPRLALVE